ncbi:MAG: glycosyltransferase family 4 protein [Ignavibacteriales bacterium]
MKILVVCQHFYPEQFRINDICYELVKRGHSVTVLTGLPNYPTGKVSNEYRFFKNRKQTINGVKIIRTFLIGRGQSIIKMAINYMSFAISASIKALLMHKRFDIVYVYQLSPITMVWPAIVVKNFGKIPLIIHCLDQWPESITTGGISRKSIVYKILLRWSRKTYNAADLITISSKSFKNYFENVLQINSNEKGLIYCPSYAESNYEKTEHIKNDYFDIVFAGNIGPAQSVETIIEAANILKDKSKILFHIVGDGLNKKNCESMAKKYNLSNIKFYGFHDIEEMKKYYDLADAFIITMVNNDVVNSTLPAKLQSYMAAGKPIVGAISGEVKNVIEESKCGLCCESLDYVSLSKIILKMFNDKNMIQQWSNNSLIYYKKHFEKDIHISNLENIMYNLIKKSEKK